MSFTTSYTRLAFWCRFRRWENATVQSYGLMFNVTGHVLDCVGTGLSPARVRTERDILQQSAQNPEKLAKTKDTKRLELTA